MSLDLTKANKMLMKADLALREATLPRKDERLRCGLDLGTASVIMVVLGENGEPLACEMQACQIARDGLVVDYMGAIAVTRGLKEKLETRLGRTLVNTAIAVPPGTNIRDSGTHRHVAEAAGLEVTAVLDEPTAACSVLGMTDGVAVDVGGGTTGLAVFENGKAVYTADEPTGGTHISLVLMGGRKISFEQAEAFKLDEKNHGEIRAAALPVMEKMAGIVKRHIRPYDVRQACLVGGTCCLTGIEDVFTRVLGIKTVKPACPMMVTPCGIAQNCNTFS